MFVNAIEKVGGYTRPVLTLMRRYGSFEVSPGAVTMFFVNEEGWAVTCKHVAKMIIDAGAIEKKYAEFKAKRAELQRDSSFDSRLKALEEMYKYKSGETTCQLKVNFVDCVDFISTFDVKLHPDLDIALIKFNGWNKLGYIGHAVFASSDDEVKQGRFLCRLGYPFPEFKNFKYDPEKDTATWTNEGLKTTPRFPVLGMITRLIGANGEINGIEMSSPGYHGMSGGPLFDANGLVYGMQAGINNLNLGHCVHMNVIKAFMIKEGVKFYEDDGSGASNSGVTSGSGSGPQGGGTPKGGSTPIDPSFFTSGGGGMIN